MRQQPSALWQALLRDLPRLGVAGSRSAGLHRDSDATPAASATARHAGLVRFALLRWIGTTGALLLALGALGGGALPVVDNPYQSFPGGTTLGQMLQASSSIVLVGVALVVLAWIGMAPLVGVSLWGRQRALRVVSTRDLWLTWIAWLLPLLLSAPIFTQDIYSYLAQGAIVREGMDPYSAGPIDLLGTDHHLARSVPFIWAHSPSPYGPVAMGFSALISALTGDSIVLGVLAHRILSVLMLAAAGWAILHIARRCRVYPPAALWLGILNPLVLLHLVGGIHNEALMLGLMLVGLELGLRALDRADRWTLPLLAASGALLSCAGMVKVTAFLSLGFIGMAYARYLHQRGRRAWWAIAVAGAFFLAVLLATIAVVSALSGIGLGWVTGQGGATTIRSWMSMTTDVGVIAGGIGMLLGLGDHSTAILVVTRLAGLAVAGIFSLRMLLATFLGRIHPVGALGVATFVLVVLFPVVHPWYVLWAVVPLAAWANRPFFRLAVVGYSAAFSFFVLPRGLALPPGTVVSIYVGAAVSLAVILSVGWWWLRRSGLVGLN
ncbi:MULTISPECIES: polyprenol phosphomannose-dependent alpha 1,6 mannosyltransferase MptB [unclassified Corynebacterium]|uniref:polyprenol phosphomannose-dependent alpha 1,6 mannosyltransferase MptB n=1 Tax=unclassified Corynebacterium TaxID=2624378 RepID=UPI0029CA099F|nr:MULTISPECIES: polyprenol phosphomannose-dependent alpha 1,6 mannosyltransferase MptB [unclassified Corynebacterium]WPF65123.1 polyprenol phosphomannose-dependent alpha 1,6 mannosyltransferase MptB [Corynebacterium sp. 22KM0430]WPF67619.1 polyprenol phosphomannose-dependent alpha 1,6 mannosyltransferase MptB [Corynebacterium sp. 21KM1197]